MQNPERGITVCGRATHLLDRTLLARERTTRPRKRVPWFNGLRTAAWRAQFRLASLFDSVKDSYIASRLPPSNGRVHHQMQANLCQDSTLIRTAAWRAQFRLVFSIVCKTRYPVGSASQNLGSESATSGKAHLLLASRLPPSNGRVHHPSIAATGRIYPTSPAGARHCHWTGALSQR